jgi:acyl carrier protein
MKAKRFAVKKDFAEHPENFVDFIAKEKVEVSFEGYDDKDVQETIKGVKKVFAKTLLLPDYKIANDAIWNVDLGGDSMSYIQMIQELEIAFGVSIPMELYGKLANVNDFALEVLTLRKAAGKLGKQK